jgi:hypothetical protein
MPDFYMLRKNALCELALQDSERIVPYICTRLREGQQSLVTSDRELILQCLSDALDSVQKNPSLYRRTMVSATPPQDPGWNMAPTYTRTFADNFWRDFEVKTRKIHMGVLVFWEVVASVAAGEDPPILALELRVVSQALAASRNQPDISSMLHAASAVVMQSDLRYHASADVRGGLALVLHSLLEIIPPGHIHEELDARDMSAWIQERCADDPDDTVRRVMSGCWGILVGKLKQVGFSNNAAHNVVIEGL